LIDAVSAALIAEKDRFVPLHPASVTLPFLEGTEWCSRANEHAMNCGSWSLTTRKFGDRQATRHKRGTRDRSCWLTHVRIISSNPICDQRIRVDEQSLHHPAAESSFANVLHQSAEA
jgi:hypothetical protein